ncbi:cholesterol 25-hydroxylase-like protein 1, member 2 [Diadema antillarum]|uniref:cholesterol 25-hydroxylase-like protein 1, member 2 n=1 Tax=Diadema antillarum TaxID=105358 RepID=UPI003A85F37B
METVFKQDLSAVWSNLSHDAMEWVRMDGSRSALQPFWDALRYYIGDEILCSPAFPVGMAVSYYFILCLIYMFLDLYGVKRWAWLRKYKLHEDIHVTPSQLYRTLNLTMWNHALYIIPAGVLQWMYSPPFPLEEDAPLLMQFLWDQTLSLFIFDLSYGILHYWFHVNRWAYRIIHSVHHQYHSPFCWVTQYLHPFELIFVGATTAIIPKALGVHTLSYYGFQIFNIWISVEAHAGYEFPFSLSVIVPFDIVAGPRKHDLHHMKPMSNYQPHLTWLDKLMGWEFNGYEKKKK